MLLIAALLYSLGYRRPALRFAVVGTVAAAYLLFLSVPALVPLRSRMLGTEGLAEAVTEGAVLAVLVRAIAVRNPWMIVGAALILVEELDYGQVLLGFQTPEFLVPDGSNSTQLNYHNTYLSGVWRIVPTAAVLLLSIRSQRLNGIIERWRLPTFHRFSWAGLVLALGLTVGIHAWLGHRIADEAFELAMVSLVYAAWIAPRRDGSGRPESGT